MLVKLLAPIAVIFYFLLDTIYRYGNMNLFKIGDCHGYN